MTTATITRSSQNAQTKATARPSKGDPPPPKKDLPDEDECEEEKNKKSAQFELREVFCVDRKMFLTATECAEYMEEQNLNVPVQRRIKKVQKSSVVQPQPALVEIQVFIADGSCVSIDQRRIIEDAIGHVITDWVEVPGTRELSGAFFQCYHKAFITPQEKIIAERALQLWRDENGDCR